MAVELKKYVYEVNSQDGKKIKEQPAVSEEFLAECKTAAQKYKRCLACRDIKWTRSERAILHSSVAVATYRKQTIRG